MTNKKNNWTSFSFIGLVQVFATITIILSALTLFDGFHRLIEQFSHFKLQYLIASVICAGVFVFYKHYKFSIVLLLIGVLNSIFVVPWYFPETQNTSSEIQTELTLLHSNVLTSNLNIKGFVDQVIQENPDVFVMQEVNQRWLSEIQELEAVYTYKHTIPRGDNFGIAIFSKIPFESIKVLNSGTFEIPTIEASLSISGHTITLIATHPLPPVSKEYYQSRNDQIINIAEMSRKNKGPLIVVGDLNVSMWSINYKPLEFETGLRNARKGFGLLPTWPAQFKLPVFMIPIDHVLVSPHFVVNEIKIGPNIGSDHLPLIVRLGIKGLDLKIDL